MRERPRRQRRGALFCVAKKPGFAGCDIVLPAYTRRAIALHSRIGTAVALVRKKDLEHLAQAGTGLRCALSDVVGLSSWLSIYLQSTVQQLGDAYLGRYLPQVCDVDAGFLHFEYFDNGTFHS
jgi:hypothetical protein